MVYSNTKIEVPASIFEITIIQQASSLPSTNVT